MEPVRQLRDWEAGIEGQRLLKNQILFNFGRDEYFSSHEFVLI